MLASALLLASAGAWASGPELPSLLDQAPGVVILIPCPAGQVIQPNGESCLPPVSAPVGTTNLYGLSPAEMSRALSPNPPRPVLRPGCTPGQILQGNGEACAR
jgi:hypothetical protein